MPEFNGDVSRTLVIFPNASNFQRILSFYERVEYLSISRIPTSMQILQQILGGRVPF